MIKYETPRKSTPEKKGDERPPQDATKCEVILTPVKSPIKEPFKEIFEERKLRESVDVKRLKDIKDDRENKEVKRVKETKADKESKERREVKPTKDTKETRETREKEHKDLPPVRGKKRKGVEKDDGSTSSEEDKLKIVLPDEEDEELTDEQPSKTDSDKNSPKPEETIKSESSQLIPMPIQTETKQVEPEAAIAQKLATPQENKEKEQAGKASKPVLQLPERYASLFPHLASLQTLVTSSPTSSTTSTAFSTICLLYTSPSPRDS